MPGIVVTSCDDLPYGPGSSDYQYDKWVQEQLDNEAQSTEETWQDSEKQKQSKQP
jgi:hypothetical protein